MARRANFSRYVPVALIGMTLAACKLEQSAPSRVVANDLYVPGNA